MEHIHQFCSPPIFIPPPTFAYEQHLNFKTKITGLNFSQPYSSDWQIGVLICVINIYSMLSVLYKKNWEEKCLSEAVPVRGLQKSLQQRRLLFTSLLSIALIFNLPAGPIQLKTSAIMFKACILLEEGHFIHIKNCIPNCNLNLMLFIKFLAEFNSCCRQQQNRKKIIFRIFPHSDYFSQIN